MFADKVRGRHSASVSPVLTLRWLRLTEVREGGQEGEATAMDQPVHYRDGLQSVDGHGDYAVEAVYAHHLPKSERESDRHFIVDVGRYRTTSGKAKRTGDGSGEAARKRRRVRGRRDGRQHARADRSRSIILLTQQAVLVQEVWRERA